MKPKPFSALKNFTVPVVNLFSSQDRARQSDGPEKSILRGQRLNTVPPRSK